MEDKHRLFLIDLMRVVCALFIFARHSITMFGCTYGPLMDEIFLQMTYPVMTCFFVLSGFSIHYQHRTEVISAGWMRSFLRKRFIAIMPSYLLVVIIWPLFYPEQRRTWLSLLPVDLLGIQTLYRTLFGVLHNGGTWFISCLFLAYVLYPVIKGVSETKKAYAPALILIVAHFILAYSNTIIPQYSLDSLYSNPIARSAEFMIGVVFSELVVSYVAYKQLSDKPKKDRYILPSGLLRNPWVVMSILLVISVVLAVLCHAGLKATVFQYLVIPVILLLLVASVYLRCESLENSSILSMVSGMTYQFFLMQLFLWNLTAWVFEVFRMAGSNTERICVSLILCTVVSLLIWKFYDKPVKNLLKKRLLKTK